MIRPKPMMLALLLSCMPQVASAQAPQDTSAPGYYLYVTAESEDVVALTHFDPVSQKLNVLKQIEVGYQPTEIEGPHGLTVSPDGKFWYLTMAHGMPYGRLYKYTTASNELVGMCELGLFPATMQISEATGLLYCVNFDLHGKMLPSTVSIVDPDEMVEVARTTTGPMPHGSRITLDGMRHYSCSMMADKLYEMDAVNFEILRTLDLTVKDEPMDHEDHGDMSHEPEGEGMQHGEGVHEHGDKQADDKKKPAMKMGGMQHGKGHDMSMHKALAKPTWVFPHPSADFVYVALNGAKQVIEIDTKAWRTTRRFATAKGPYNVEISRDAKRMLITYKGAQSVGVWDLEAGEELAQLATSQPITHGVVISPDSRFAFVSNEGIGATKGTLDVIELASNSIVASVEIGLQAGGIAFWKHQ